MNVIALFRKIVLVAPLFGIVLVAALEVKKDDIHLFRYVW